MAADDATIRSADVRKLLLNGNFGNGDDKEPTHTAELRVKKLCPDPELDIIVTHNSLSRSGAYLALAGPTLADVEINGLYVITDLPATSSIKRSPCPVPAIRIDSELFSSRPGLSIVQMAWHPYSDRHLTVLTSDAVWRMYDVGQPLLPEQIFELKSSRLGRGRLGLVPKEKNSGNEKSFAGFAFPPDGAQGWEHFCVYFQLADGQICTLCPVVPFNCLYSRRVIDGLSTKDSSTSAAWVQRSFQPVTKATPGGEALVTSMPHALETHCPSLVGPIALSLPDGQSCAHNSYLSADPSLALNSEEEGDEVQAMHMVRVGEGCIAVLLGSGKGAVGVHLLTGCITPVWEESPPQCLLSPLGELLSVRSQLGYRGSLLSSQLLLLLDVVLLAVKNHSTAERRPDATTKRITFTADSEVEEMIYVIHSSVGIALINVPWLTLVTAFICGDHDLPAVLPPASSCLVYSGKSVVDAVAVGDRLSGSGVIALTSTGKHVELSKKDIRSCMVSAPVEKNESTPTFKSSSVESIEKDVADMVKIMYEDVLSGPTPLKLPALPSPKGPLSADNIQGQQYLSGCIAALRASHVEFIHRSHHDLTERLKAIKKEAEQQKVQLQSLQALVQRIGAASRSLDERAMHAGKLQDNIEQRLQLLAELHAAVPHPSSAAEKYLANVEFPRIESSIKSLESSTRMLKGRTAMVRAKHSPDSYHITGRRMHVPIAVPPAQLRKVREALSQHGNGIETALRELTQLEKAVADAETLMTH